MIGLSLVIWGMSQLCIGFNVFIWESDITHVFILGRKSSYLNGEISSIHPPLLMQDIMTCPAMATFLTQKI